jgi:hypothetical protein
MAKTTQTSRKAGVKSSSKKADTSRYGTAPHPATHPVAGAFGEEPRRGRTRVPGTASTHGGKGAAARNQHRTNNAARRSRG